MEGPQELPPWQEPVAALQVPPLRVQSTQAVPPLPQALLALPPRHWLFWQQPLAQVDGLHPPPPWQLVVAGLQVCPLRVQSTQKPPPEPQALLARPPWHWSFWQHPLGQLAGPQPPEPQLPLTHDWPWGQGEQSIPIMPHWESLVG